MSIKASINAILERFGYRFVDVERYKSRYRKLVREIEAAYQEFVFRDGSSSDETRLDLLAVLEGTAVSEALYILHALSEALPLEGDVCEFGIAQGATSALMAHAILETTKHLWLFDSFEGLPKPTDKDQLKDDIFGLGSMAAYEGTMANPQHLVERRLHAIRFPTTRVHIVPGFIETTIEQGPLPERVCFTYVDFDFYEPIRTALRFLDEVLVTEGVVIVDDYDFFSTGAKTAVDEFMDAHKKRYTLSLPARSGGHFCILQKTA